MVIPAPWGITVATGANAPACVCGPETFLLVPVKPGVPDGVEVGRGLTQRQFRPTIHHDSALRLVTHKGECPLTDEVWYKDRRIM